MKVIQYSIGRSGSTLITQILQSLEGVQVRTSHRYHRNLLRHKMVIPYRDFRDVFVSDWRSAQGISDDSLLGDGRKMQESEVRKWLLSTKECVPVLNRNLKSNPHALLLKYERFVNDFDYIFDSIGKYLGLEISARQRAELTDKFSLKANKARAQHLKSFLEWDKDGIHGHHVFTGEIGTWRKIVDPSAHALVNELLKDELELWGYLV